MNPCSLPIVDARWVLQVQRGTPTQATMGVPIPNHPIYAPIPVGAPPPAPHGCSLSWHSEDAPIQMGTTTLAPHGCSHSRHPMEAVSHSQSSYSNFCSDVRHPSNSHSGAPSGGSHLTGRSYSNTPRALPFSVCDSVTQWVLPLPISNGCSPSKVRLSEPSQCDRHPTSSPRSDVLDRLLSSPSSRGASSLSSTRFSSTRVGAPRC